MYETFDFLAQILDLCVRGWRWASHCQYSSCWHVLKESWVHRRRNLWAAIQQGHNPAHVYHVRQGMDQELLCSDFDGCLQRSTRSIWGGGLLWVDFLFLQSRQLEASKCLIKLIINTCARPSQMEWKSQEPRYIMIHFLSTSALSGFASLSKLASTASFQCQGPWRQSTATCTMKMLLRTTFPAWSLTTEAWAIWASLCFDAIVAQHLLWLLRLRGVSMQFSSTRKKPNAFNLLHQLRLLRSGQQEFEEAQSSC